LYIQNGDGSNDASDMWRKESEDISAAGVASSAHLRESLEDLVAMMSAASSHMDVDPLVNDTALIWGTREPLGAHTVSSSTATCTELSDLFRRTGLGKYTDLFQQQEVRVTVQFRIHLKIVQSKFIGYYCHL